MTISTDQYSIKALFEQKQTFSVPKYQRGYAWDDEAVIDFIEDLTQCLRARLNGTEKNHFFGGVVTVRHQIGGSTRDNYEIIDGQQRLASFVLLAGCLIKFIGQLLEELGPKEVLEIEEAEVHTYLSETTIALGRLYLTYRDNKGIQYSDVPKLILSKADNNFFQKVIADRVPMEISRESHRRILNAWECFNAFVKSNIFVNDLPASDKAIRLQQFLDDVLGRNCSAIFMCSDTRSEAYHIFQVLNDRGVQLGKGDLLRARTLELLDADKQETIQDEVSEVWDDVLVYSPRAIDDYLLWYFSSVEGRRPKPANLADEFLEHRFDCMDNDILNDSGAEKICNEVNELSKAFSTFATMSEGNWPWTDTQDVTAWDRERLRILVTHLQHTNAMPLFLSLKMLGPKKFAEAIASIERFVFRYKTIVNAHIAPLTNLYLKHALAIRQSRRYSVRRLRSDLEDLSAKHAPDSIFRPALRELKYSPKRSNAHIRYFFMAMEDYGKWADSNAQGVPKCRDKTRIIDLGATTIEHIYPQNAREVDKDSALEDVKHSLGNLTILGPDDNQSKTNDPPANKSDVFSRSHMRLNRTLDLNNGWTRTIVNQRTEMLAAKALKVFVP